VRPNHILSVDQFDRPWIDDLFGLTEAMKTAHPASRFAPGQVLANLFYEASTRTSASFHSAMNRLGGHVLPIQDVSYSSVSKGENLEDTIRTMACYADAIVLRHPEVGAATRAAAVSPVPIINAGDGVAEHPTQALLDLYTIQAEQGRLDGLSITMVGDLKHGRTVHSLTKLLRHYDVRLNFVSPAVLAMPSEYVQPSDGQFDDLSAVVATSDVIYVTRVQRERLPTGLMIDPNYAITQADMAAALPNMTLMHPLPRVSEIPAEIDSDPRAAYFRQVKNGLFVRMALLRRVLEAS
jgi:aspartate carbamoyltransferase catalytic subunit